MHLFRAAVFAAVVVLIHWQHQKFSRGASDPEGVAFGLAEVRRHLPQADQLKPQPNNIREVLDAKDNRLGIAVQTSPNSDRIVGFSGPTNVLLVFDAESQLAGMSILSSKDTTEHVDAVQKDPGFLKPLNQKTWDELAQGDFEVDAVSGATLTSMAMLESIMHRLGGSGLPSLRFPEPVQLKAVQKLFPAAASISDRQGTFGLQSVHDNQGQPIGSVLRTSPAADRLIGYQGPTDTLIGFDPNGECIGIVVQHSYDNAEYVDYVRDEEYFLSLFNGQTLDQLAELDVEDAGVEGVSGATMTSQTVAESLSFAAREAVRQRDVAPRRQRPLVTMTLRDWGTSAVLLGGLLIGFTNLRGKKWVRVPFQWLLIGYLGFINGDLVSQAVLVGWAEHGVPWRSALGLVLLTGAAVLIPLISRQNVYCHHLCPHGAAQQLLRNRLPWQLSLPRPLVRALSMIPGVLLAVVVVVAMLSLSLSLVNLEPFDAYVFQVAGAATLTIFVVGLLASLFVPMAYCRFGCPTGALLGYLRFHGHSDRFSRRDALAVGLLILALLLFATKT